MAQRQLGKLVPALLAAARGAGASACRQQGASILQTFAPAVSQLSSLWNHSIRSLHFSSLLQEENAPANPYGYPEVLANGLPKLYEPPRKFRPLADKELWHEAWMYEERFGTEEDPIVVPSLEGERIIGCTDPEDDTLVVWGILRAGEPPRQFIENGEFYLLKTVPYVAKVGDVLDYIAAGNEKDVARS